MKRFFVFFLLYISMTMALHAIQQQYKSHKVEQGETVYSIAKKYSITPEAIYAINPTAKEGIQIGVVLAIPVTQNYIDEQNAQYKMHTVVDDDTVYNIARKYNTTPEYIYELNPNARQGIKLGQELRIAKITVEEQVKDQVDTVIESFNIEPEFKIHKVKRKETLYSIAKQYGVTVDDIKKYNKELYSRDVRKREKIRIPILKEKIEETVDTPIVDEVATYTQYIVKPKETKFSIARKHGITIQELEQLNPTMEEVLSIGAEIKVPTAVFVEYSDVVEEGFELYQVPPKDTMFSLLRRLNISSDSLIKMNPYLRDGLKAGMILTIPSAEDSLVVTFDEDEKINLENKLYNFKTKKVAIMLPFDISNLNIDVPEETEAALKNKRNLRIALDFYSGALIAIDSAKSKGISTEISVFDTRKNNNIAEIKRIIANNNFDEFDAVIGPLYQKNVEMVAGELKRYDIPVISPITKKESKLYSNFFQARPTDVMLEDKMIEYVEKDSTDKNLIIITDLKNKEIKEKLKAKFPNAKVLKMREGGFLYEIDIVKVLDKSKPNWVFLESNSVASVSNVITYLNARAETHQITLFTTDKNKAFDNDNVSNEDLLRLRFHYPSVEKEYNEDALKNFITRYKKENNGIVPNQYAVKGFDITYDILMRLGTANNLFEASMHGGTTEYIENKFNYSKKLLGGYYNKAMYIVKYDENLKLTVVE